MADIAWSAYALAMFTPEERAAAMAAVPDPGLPPVQPPLPPVIPVGGEMSVVGGIRITGPGIPPEGYNPNDPKQITKLYELGWTFQNGKWFAPKAPGVPVTPTEALATTGGRAPGLSSIVPLSAIAGGSVLGVTVPAAAPVLLPSWVGGRVGTVRRSGGTRPESGGTPQIVRGFGPREAWQRVVR